MSPELLTALTTGIISIITALGALLASLRNHEKIVVDGREKEQKLEQIHGLVNSRLSEALEAIGKLQEQISSLGAIPVIPMTKKST
jgi:hypothetical protein